MGIEDLYNEDRAKNFISSTSLESVTYYRQEIGKLCHGDVLELGCGNGRYLQALRYCENYIGVDYSIPMLKASQILLKTTFSDYQKKAMLVAADIQTIEFKPKSFDFIFSVGTLGEYTRIDEILSRKILSWMKDGGKAYFTLVEARDFSFNHSRLGCMLNAIRDSRKNSRFFHDFKLNYRLQRSKNVSFRANHVTKGQVVKILEQVEHLKNYEIETYRDSKHLKIILKLTKV